MARGPRNQSNQEATEAVRRTIARDRFATGLNGRVLKILQDLEREVIAKLAQFDPGDASRRAQRLKKLQREVAAEVTRRYNLVRKEATGELKELALDEARWKEASLGRSWNSTGANIDVALAPDATLEALVSQPVVLGGIASDFWKKQGDELSAKFAREMQLGVSGGESIGDLMSRVRGSKARGLPGIMEVSRRDAESLVRTSVNSIANEAHMTVMLQNADVIEGVQHVSVLDSRTTVLCAGRHNRMWKLEGLEPIGHDLPFAKPPLHWRCRSIISSVLNVAEPPPSLDFKDYFDGLAEADQNEIFGVGRAQLFREGRISQKDLLSTAGRPLSLRELREEHGDPTPKRKSTKLPPKIPDPQTRPPVLKNRDALIKSPGAVALAKEFSVSEAQIADIVEDMLGDAGPTLAGKINGTVKLLGGGNVKRDGFEFVMTGGPIEYMQRTFRQNRAGGWEVYHAYLGIDKKTQGGGIGRSIMRGSLGVYKKLGISKITVTANIDIGGYTWARFGFGAQDVFAFRDQARLGLGKILRGGFITQKEHDDAITILRSNIAPDRLPFEFASLITKSGYKLGKEALLNSGWRGYVDLADPAHLDLFEKQIDRKS